MLDRSELAGTFVDFLRGDGERLIAQVDEDCLDNVSGQRGPKIWRTAARWLSTTFCDPVVVLEAIDGAS